MLRETPKGLEVYVPKKDLETLVVERERDPIWGGWIRLKNGLVLELPDLDEPPTLPATINARVRKEED